MKKDGIPISEVCDMLKILENVLEKKIDTKEVYDLSKILEDFIIEKMNIKEFCDYLKIPADRYCCRGAILTNVCAIDHAIKYERLPREYNPKPIT